jgi:hypothetical protein
MTSRLEELAAKVEKLTRPCRETDRAVFEAALLESEINRRGADSWFCAVDGSSYGFNLDSAPTGSKVAWCGELPRYTASLDAAASLFPWRPHPCATRKTNLIQSGVDEFYCFVEFTWPSTEIQGRARDEVRATLACALRAIERTNEDLAPYRARAASEPSHGR